ncbi:hypothetical protein JCM1841_002668 [Sporobolomyces salmonicolor]
MSTPTVFASQLPNFFGGRRLSPAVETDSDDDGVPSGRPGRSNTISLSIRELKQLELSSQRNCPSARLPLSRRRRCRGATVANPLPKLASLSCAVLGGRLGFVCDSCPECLERRRRRRNRSRSGNRDPLPSLRDFSIPAETAGDNLSVEYLRAAAVPSKPVSSDHPLVVISLDGVVDARLPKHLSGGWTDVLSRPNLTTFMDYLLSRQSPSWSFVFFQLPQP